MSKRSIFKKISLISLAAIGSIGLVATSATLLASCGAPSNLDSNKMQESIDKITTSTNLLNLLNKDEAGLKAQFKDSLSEGYEFKNISIQVADSLDNGYVAVVVASKINPTNNKDSVEEYTSTLKTQIQGFELTESKFSEKLNALVTAENKIDKVIQNNLTSANIVKTLASFGIGLTEANTKSAVAKIGGMNVNDIKFNSSAQSRNITSDDSGNLVIKGEITVEVEFNDKFVSFTKPSGTDKKASIAANVKLEDKKEQTVENVANSTIFQTSEDGKTINGVTNLPEGTTELTIPSTIETIGKDAFKDSSLTKIDFSKATNLKTIGEGAFAGTNVTSIDLSSTKVETIGKDAFAGVAKTTTPTTKTGEATDPEYTSSLETITLPTTITTIGEGAFQNAISLKTINGFEKTQVTEVSKNLFSGAKSLSTLSLGEKITKIGDGAFQYTNLEAMGLSNLTELTEIGASTFANTLVASVDLSSNTKLNKIGTGAFASMSQLTTFVLPSTITDLSENLFKDSTLLNDVKIASAANPSTKNTAQSTNVSIFEKVTKIGANAFQNTSIANVDLSKNTNSSITIEANAFDNAKLTSFVLPKKADSGSSGTPDSGTTTKNSADSAAQTITIASKALANNRTLTELDLVNIKGDLSSIFTANSLADITTNKGALTIKATDQTEVNKLFHAVGDSRDTYKYANSSGTDLKAPESSSSSIFTWFRKFFN